MKRKGKRKMSEENHPSIQAVGLTTDIITSIEKW